MALPMESGGIDFTLCEILYKMTSVLESFPNSERLLDEIHQVLTEIQQKKMQVAVIGEFRRGKSTLMNALLGMPILPTDIVPTTAAINRITYGLKPRAIIHYKDGTEKEVPIADLPDYVTKITPEAQSTAATVQEAEVQYPTELCRNHIDIIDTPGLNDTESMTAVTEQMLDEINVAIVTVDANIPYSKTELCWVVRLLALPKLQHMVFVLTRMDQVAERDREKILSFTSERIREATLDRVHQQYEKRSDLIAKAQRIFGKENFHLYPVSAILALDSFSNGDYELLEESNIPSLKKALIGIMNAQQQMMGVYRTQQVVNRIAEEYSRDPMEQQIAALREQRERLSNANQAVHAYFEERPTLIDQAMKSMNGELDKTISTWMQSLDTVIRDIFTKQVNTVVGNSSAEMAAAIERAQVEIRENVLKSLQDGLQKAVNAAIIRSVNAFLESREHKLQYTAYSAYLETCGFPASSAMKNQAVAPLREGISYSLPEFSMKLPKLLLNQNVVQTVVAPYISLFCTRYRKAWQDAMPGYANQWESVIQCAEPVELSGQFDHWVHTRMGRLEEQERTMTASCEKLQNIICESKANLEAIQQCL